MIQADRKNIYVCIAIKILTVITYFAMGSIESRETMTQRIIVDNATCSRMHAEIITSITFDYSFMKNQMIIKKLTLSISEFFRNKWKISKSISIIYLPKISIDPIITRKYILKIWVFLVHMSEEYKKTTVYNMNICK